MSAKQTAAARKTWTEYERAMVAARDATSALTDALSRYLRRGGRDAPCSAFDAVCESCIAYTCAVKAAAPYHYGVIPWCDVGHVINYDNEDLLDLLRQILGREETDVREVAPGYRVVQIRRIGVADYYDAEVRAMRKFGSPRRAPEQSTGPLSVHATITLTG